MREIELKFEVDEDFDVSILASAGDYEMDELPPEDLAAAYYDTADLKLARWGASLRYRKGEADGDAWTLKLPASEGREEFRFEAAAGRVPAEATVLLTALVRGNDLKQVASIRTKRKRWTVREREAAPKLAELAFDEVAILKGRRVVKRFREIEIEAVETDGVGLARIGNALRENGARDSDQSPKINRALGDAAAAAPDVASGPDIKPSDPAREAVRAALAANVSRLISNDPLTRLGRSEGLHQMRVACRRTRSDLKTFGRLVDAGWASDLARDLKWTGDVLGKVRDLDVMIDRLHASSKDIDGELGPLFEMLVDRQRSARKAAETALRSKRYVDLLERLVQAANEPVTTEEAERSCEETLVPLVTSRWRKLAASAQSTGNDAPDEVLHDIRIKAKKTRYAAEAVAPSLGKKLRKELLAFAEKVASLQEVLGAHQDATVAMRTIRDAATTLEGDADFVFASGQLFERQALAAKSFRKDLKTTWAKIDRKKNLGWLTT